MAQNSPTTTATAAAVALPLLAAGTLCLAMAGSLMWYDPAGNVYAIAGFITGTGVGLCLVASVLASGRIVRWITR